MRKESFDIAFVLLACLIGWTAGCQKPPETAIPGGGRLAENVKKNAKPPGVTLKLLVVGDPELAGGIKRLRGEWAERSGGGQLQVLEWSLPELIAAESLPADLVVYPSRYLGTLVSKNGLRPLRNSVLHAPQFAHADLLPAIRDKEIVYGSDIYSIPYGSPPLMLCYNAQVLQAAGCRVPQTWIEYRQVARRLADQAIPCQLPLAGQSAAITLLARAINYARQSGHMAMLFDLDTFQPRIAGPPFIRALAEITAEITQQQQATQEKRASATSSLQDAAPLLQDVGVLDFRDSVKEVTLGRAGLTLGWPGLYCPSSTEAARDLVGANYTSLPRAVDCYNATRNQWESNRLDTPMTLLGVAGRLASVTTASRNAASAFKLLLWLGSDKTATEISTRSRYTLWYRHSQVKAAQLWLTGCQGLKSPNPTANATFSATAGSRPLVIARTVTQALVRDDCFLLPRIPEIDQYLASLANAVRGAIAGETAASALQRTADEWEQITERQGREGQQLAYRAHLGLP